MSLGCAAVTTFLVLKTWRLFGTKDIFLHRFNLKFSGRIRPVGWAFVAFSILWIGLTAHTGWIRYHEYEGDNAFQKLQIPDELALAQINPDAWLSPLDRESISEGEKHFQAASDWGLFKNGDALSKLGWFKYLSGNAEQSVDLLSVAADHQKNGGQSKALSLYYRGTILNRLGRYDQAQVSLDQALTERDDLILARQEKGESLWQLGRRDEAISVWSDAVQRNPRLALVNNELAGAKQSLGKVEEASSHERQADQFTPNDPLFHWMIGRRLQDLGMTDLAEKHFQRANQLDPRSGLPGER